MKKPKQISPTRRIERALRILRALSKSAEKDIEESVNPETKRLYKHKKSDYDFAIELLTESVTE